MQRERLQHLLQEPPEVVPRCLERQVPLLAVGDADLVEPWADLLALTRDRRAEAPAAVEELHEVHLALDH
eukprot:10592933-Alexandrium_andersonii.AAC.1